MIDRGKQNVLGVQIDAVDYEAAVERIIQAARRREPLALSALAVHGVMTGVRDPKQRHRLNHLDMLVPDGQPVRWAIRWLADVKLPGRVYGPTLMLKVCERAAGEGLPIYLYGSSPRVVETLAVRLQERFPTLRIAGTSPSRFRQVTAEEKQQIAAQIRESGAAICFVGLGCPRQETWVYEYRNDLPMPLLAVGAAFDFHAGLLPQAPPLLQEHGLEWLFRLFHEPKRLWRRYLLLNPLYLLLVFLQATGLRAFPPSRTTPPVQEMRYG